MQRMEKRDGFLQMWVLGCVCCWFFFVPFHHVLTKLSNEESLKLMKELSSSIKPLQYCVILLRCLFHQHWPDLVLL